MMRLPAGNPAEFQLVLQRIKPDINPLGTIYALETSGTLNHNRWMLETHHRYREGGTMNRRLIILGAVAAAVILAGCTATTGTPSAPCNVTCTAPTQAQLRTISVNGEGTVKVTPDIALIYMSVISQGPDVSKTWDDNNSKSAAVIAAVEGLGVKAEDIQSDFTLTQQDKYDPVTHLPTGEIVYFVTHTLTVTARDLTKVGGILGTAQAAGVNSVGGVTFTLENPKPAITQARDLAMADAQARANQMAKDLNITIVRVISVNDYGINIPFTVDKGYSTMTGIGGGGGGSTVPIQVGTWQVTVTVSVVFEIG
jgi:uncharacterized protein YggE